MRPLPATLATLLVLAVLAVGYVLSYAPVYWVLGRPDTVDIMWPHNRPWPDNRAWPHRGERKSVPGYQPVEWMIDETLLSEPLLKWAGLWGVRGKMETDYVVRRGIPIGP